MTEPKPVLTILGVEAVMLVLLASWWVRLPPATRLYRLTQVAVIEQSASLPPLRPLAQPRWLMVHRQQRLTGMVGVGVLGLVIGLSEGMARRQRDIKGGFLLAWWTSGVLLVPVLVGVVVGYLVVPVPLPLAGCAVGLAALTGLSGYGLGAGRPEVN